MSITERREYLAPEVWRAQQGYPFSKNNMYAAIRDGKMPHVRIGKRILIPEDALDQMLQSQAKGL